MSNNDRGSVPPVSPDPPPGEVPRARGASDGGLLETSTANAQLIYVLYLLGFVLGGLSNIAGVVFAYLYKEGADAWLRTHYDYQIRTFWLLILYSVIATILAFIVIGFLIYILNAIWLILRCIKGLTRLQKQQPIDDVRSWWV